MLMSLDADGIFDPETGLLTQEVFWRDFSKAIAEATDHSQALSVARFSFDGSVDRRSVLDCARLVTRLIRNIDFAFREDDGAILIVFTQTDLRSAHVVARRIAGALKNAIAAAARRHEPITANVTLATLKVGDTLDSLMMRVTGSRVVAAE
jgi:GGDEF domain-containing protein